MSECEVANSSGCQIGIVGAGLAGATAYRFLKDHGHDVTIFEKSRGVGGRMATRRVDGQPCFDHGAQYFTVRDDRFRKHVDKWLDSGEVARWPAEGQRIVVLDEGVITEKPDGVERFVGCPAMNSFCKQLAYDAKIIKSTRVETIKQNGNKVQLVSEEDETLGDFDRVVVTAPAEQSALLLSNYPALATLISQIEMRPCWATMASFAHPITDTWVGAFIHSSFLSWAARNSTKPMRPSDQEHLLLHAAPEWTAEHWQRDPDWVAAAMLSEFWKASRVKPTEPTHLNSHRWKYAIPLNAADERCFFDAKAGIVVCGDWCGGPRVEGAFLSGLTAAEAILKSL